MNRLTICVIVLAIIVTDCAAGTWVTLDKSNDDAEFQLSGVDGSNVVGYTMNGSLSNPLHGVLYNGSTWTNLQYSGPNGANVTSAYGISGSRIVGRCRIFVGSQIEDVSFLYNTTTHAWSIVDADPMDSVHGIDGDSIVGSYKDSSGNYHGFLNSITSPGKTIFDYPDSTSTHALGIDGSSIVGWYTDVSGNDHGYVYAGGNYTPIDYPGAAETTASDISGNTVVGFYYNAGSTNAHSFIYTNGIYTPLDRPGATLTIATSISGNKIVGNFDDAAYNNHGFIYTIPEPGTVGLLALGGMILRGRKKF